MTSVKERVIHIVSHEFGIDDGRIDTQTHLAADLGVDSIDRLEFVIQLEEDFRLNIPDDICDKLQTIGDAIEIVAKGVRRQRGSLLEVARGSKFIPLGVRKGARTAR